ncbi:MAG: LysE family translocator [Actinobacteria bacterium]|nr:LysE family translocator [Actinomycetota bacterium]
MPTQQTLLAFALVAAGIMVIPGPSNFFLLAHGIGHGRRSALAAMTGIEAAAAIRVLLAAAGLSAVLAASALAFGLIRWAGVAYLAWLGVRAFRSHPAGSVPGGPGRPVPFGRSARKGLIVGLGNPKMVIFYLAFFPQFVHPGHGSRVTQMLVLGALFWVIGAIWDLAFASASGAIGTWLAARPRIQAAQPRLEGLAYLGLAGWAAVTGARPAGQ